MRTKKVLSKLLTVMLATMIVAVNFNLEVFAITNSNGFDIDANGVLNQYYGTETSITIPDEVTEIKDYAFYDLPLNGPRVSLPINSITITENSKLKKLTNLSLSHNISSLKIYGGVERIEYNFMGLNQNLTEVILPPSLKYIGVSAFWLCGFTHINIPNGVTTIDDTAFSGSKLEEIELPDSVIKLGYSVFAGNINLKKVILSNNLTSISDMAFCDCTSLEEINIPNSVKSIEQLAFARTGLTKITLPYGVTSIGDEAFAECNKLINVTIPKSVTKIEESAFDNSKRVTINCYKGSYAEKYAKKYKIKYKLLDSTTSTPSKISGLKATSNKSNKLKLSWNKSDNAKYYLIFQYKDGAWEQLKKTSSKSYTVSSLDPATSYKFKVVAYNSSNKAGKGATISTATATEKIKLNSVEKKSKNSISINWEQDTAVNGYEILVSNSKKGDYSVVKTLTKNKYTTYTYKGLESGKAYYIKMRSYKKVGNTKVYGAYSSVKSLKLK